MEMESHSTMAGPTGFMPEEQGPPDRAKVGQDKNYHRIQYIVSLMQKFRTSDISTIKKKILPEPQLWQKYTEMMSLANFDVICKKAVELYRTELCHRPLVETFEDPDPTWRSNRSYMTTSESVILFHKWCEFNNFDVNQFLDDIFDVLEKKTPKINTFCLQGPPNCGKSYLMRSLVAWYPFFGEARGGGTSYAFLWHDCVDTAIIFIEEPYITPAEVEQFKLVFEGAETHVHVKNKGDALLQSTPVIVTCNNLPWRWVMGEEAALRARMKIYYCKEMPWLKDEKRYINPQMWAYLYHLYRNKENQEIAAAVEALMHDMDESTEMVPTTPHISISSDEDEPPAKRRLQWDGEHCTLSNGSVFTSTPVKIEIVNVPTDIIPCKCTCLFRDNHILMYDDCICFAQRDCMHAENARKCCLCPLACHACDC